MGLFFVQLGICNEKIPLVFSGIFELDLYVVVIPNPYIFFWLKVHKPCQML